MYDKPVFGKLRVVAVMLICFYAHHNRYARCADTGGQGQGG
jgi:hypothetical protein